MNGDVIEEMTSSEEDEMSSGAADGAQDGNLPAAFAREILMHLADYVVEEVEQSRAEEAVLAGDDLSDSNNPELSAAQRRLASYQQQMNDRFMSADQPLTRLFSVKKSIFIRNRVESHLQSTQASSKGAQQEELAPTSALTAMLDEEEEEDENDFRLQAPDKYNPMTSHLCISITFWIGGKKPLKIGPCELSRKHKVSDVIRHVLTLYRKKPEIKDVVKFASDDRPEAFDLRHVDDDDSGDSDGQCFQADTDMPALDHQQDIGEFDQLVLVQKKGWKGAAAVPKTYSFMYNNYI